MAMCSGRKTILAIAGMALFSIANVIPVDAMQFSNPVKIGSYYNGRAGGPSLARGEGYTQMTDKQCVFGHGNTALKFTHKNMYSPMRRGRQEGSSTCTGVYIGQQKVESLRYLNGEIYRITGDQEEVFYFVYGGAALDRSFALIGLCEGSYYHAIGISDLSPYVGSDLRSVGSAADLILSTPRTVGDEILVDVKDYRKNTVGQFIFKWDESAQWFGIEYQSY